MSDAKKAGAKWLESLGFPDAEITTPMDALVERWIAFHDATADWYEYDENDTNGNTNTVKIRSMTPANMICEDLSGLLFNEAATIGVVEDEDQRTSEWLANWLDSTKFCDTAPLLIHRMCETGTAAWALRLENVAATGLSSGLKIAPQRYDATHMVPLSFTEDECTEMAFFSKAYLRGCEYTQMQAHFVGDNGNYWIANALCGEDGKIVEINGILNGELDTKQQLPTFAICKLALDNPYWRGSPFGVSLIDKTKGAIETVDRAFDNIGNDIFLGKKMVFLDHALLRKNDNGTYSVPMVNGKQFFVALENQGVGEDGTGITEYNPDLRADDNKTMLSTALQVLGKRCGFGDNYYRLDAAGGLKTATEVASDNSELMRTLHRHEKFIKPAIASICEAAVSVANSLGGAGIPDITGKTNVVMGDSIIQDDDALRERDRADVAIGALPLWVYIMRWQGVDEATAREWAGEDDVSIPYEA